MWGGAAPAALHGSSDSIASAQNHQVGQKRSGSQQRVEIHQQHMHPQQQQRQRIDSNMDSGGSDQFQHRLEAPPAPGASIPSRSSTSSPEVALATRYRTGRPTVPLLSTIDARRCDSVKRADLLLDGDKPSKHLKERSTSTDMSRRRRAVTLTSRPLGSLNTPPNSRAGGRH